tara:strand:- start:496 stop:723 length:228 start_codon:yes stop_codon:yes gene_type:complete
MSKMKAFKEASFDTGIGILINAPLNFLFVSLAFYLDLTALWTTIMLTVVFTIFALIRKTAVRLHFSKKQEKNNAV